MERITLAGVWSMFLEKLAREEEVIETYTCCQRELVGCGYPKSRETISS
jgi:hypothetical protein